MRLRVQVLVLSVAVLVAFFAPGSISTAAPLPISINDHQTTGLSFAASEWSHYLRQVAPKANPDAVRLQINPELDTEEYRVIQGKGGGSIEGGSSRAILYGVYQELQALGCRWFAPSFEYYHGDNELTPRLIREFALVPLRARPQLRWRKLYVEEGISHTTQSLLQIVDWMPKAGYNVLVVPTDYRNNGRVKWDNWREAVTPELKRRGLLLEVGGHGYENFIGAKLQGGAIFRGHPEWFGTDENGKRSRKQNRVFCTSNAAAVKFFADSINTYLQEHPEIDIFAIWPPDGAQWCECPECRSLGLPSDRQARLLNSILPILRRNRPGLKLETIAYGATVDPPLDVKLNPDILVDFCPINQCFEFQIFAPESKRNVGYANSFLQWTKQFRGDICIYSYYRKYAWKSLPVLLPHFMQKDVQWYANKGAAGVSIYSEPADWTTYEVSHYTLPRIAWNTQVDVDQLLQDYSEKRFKSDRPIKVIAALERTVRRFGSIPYTELKSADELTTAREELSVIASELKEVPSESSTSGALSRLKLESQYAIRDLDIQQARAAGDSNKVAALVNELASFLESHSDDGVFMVYHGTSTGQLLRKYSIPGIKSKSATVGANSTTTSTRSR